MNTMATKRDRKTAFPFIKPRGSIKKDILQYRNQNSGDVTDGTENRPVQRRESSASRFFRHLRPERNNPVYHSEGKGNRKKKSSWTSEREIPQLEDRNSGGSNNSNNKLAKDRSRSFNEQDAINQLRIASLNGKENGRDSFRWRFRRSAEKISPSKELFESDSPAMVAPSSDQVDNHVLLNCLTPTEEADYVNVDSMTSPVRTDFRREPDLLRNLPLNNGVLIQRTASYKMVPNGRLINSRSESNVVSHTGPPTYKPRLPMHVRTLEKRVDPRSKMSLPCWDAEDWNSGATSDEESNYALQLRTSMAALLGKQSHVRQGSANSTGSNYSSYSSDDMKINGISSVLNDSGYETFHQDLQYYCKQYGGWMDPPDPPAALLLESSPPPSMALSPVPPPPPVRDASSLHRVYSHRTQPKQPNSLGSYQLKPVLENSDRIPAAVDGLPDPRFHYSDFAKPNSVSDYIGQTPLMDQLRRDLKGSPVSLSNGRDSVATVATQSSGSSGSNDTTRSYGSYSDISIVSGTSSRFEANPLVVRSSKVRSPQRHKSESVLFFTQNNMNPLSTSQKQSRDPIPSQPQAQDQKSSVDDSPPPSVQERIHQLERQSKSVPDLASRWRSSKQEQAADPSFKVGSKEVVRSYYERQRKISDSSVGPKSLQSPCIAPAAPLPPQRPPKRLLLLRPPNGESSPNQRKPPAPDPPPSPPLPPPPPPPPSLCYNASIADEPLPPPPPAPEDLNPVAVLTSSVQVEQPKSFRTEVRIPLLGGSQSPIPEGAAKSQNHAPLQQRTKRKEELECERLSEDLMNHLSPSDKLHAVLRVPGPDHPTTAQIMEGICLEPKFTSDSPSSISPLSISPMSNSPASVSPATVSPSKVSSSAPLPATSVYFTISEQRAKLLTRYGQDLDRSEEMHEPINSELLAKKKEDLMSRLERKLDILRSERVMLQEEIETNEALGRAVAQRIGAVASPTESNKVALHVTEVDKITALLLALAGRLARAENALVSLPIDVDTQERAVLEGKRDKLLEQLEEAKSLKENIDRRSQQVAALLSKYLSDEEFADYSHFITMKAKLVTDAKEIDDKIKLGEEQLAALQETLHLRPKFSFATP